MRVYVHPTKQRCNAMCKFCITKTQFKDSKEFSKLPEELLDGKEFGRSCKKIKDICREMEFTGGGEPALNKYTGDLAYIAKIIVPNLYTKLYTNSLCGINFDSIDELNISRMHWDNDTNEEIMGANNDELFNQLKYAKEENKYKKVRIQIILMKGFIDSEEKLLEWIDKWGEFVDVFMVRELFGKCPSVKELFVPQLKINHPKVKLDITNDYCDSRPIIATNGKLYEDWSFKREW